MNIASSTSDITYGFKDYLESLHDSAVYTDTTPTDSPSINVRDEVLLRGGWRSRFSKMLPFWTEDSGRNRRIIAIAHYRPMPIGVPLGFNLGEAFVVPPPRWESLDKIPLLSRELVPLLGHDTIDLPEECLAYVSQADLSGTCLPACIAMALLSLGPYRLGAVVPEGIFTLSCVAQMVAYQPIPSDADPAEFENVRRSILSDSGLNSGITKDRHRHHSRDWRAGCGGIPFTIGRVPFEAIPHLIPLLRQYGLKTKKSQSPSIRGYLYSESSEDISSRDFKCALFSIVSSRLPAICRVDRPLLRCERENADSWKDNNCSENDGDFPTNTIHAVCVVGSDNLMQESDETLVCYQDPANAPFQDCEIGQFLMSAKTRLSYVKDKLDPKHYSANNKVVIAYIVPQGVRFDIGDAMTLYRTFWEAVRDDYVREKCRDPHWWRIRMLTSEQARRAYLDIADVSILSETHSCDDMELVREFRYKIATLLNPLDRLLCLELYQSNEAARNLIPDAVLFIDAPVNGPMSISGGILSGDVEEDEALRSLDLNDQTLIVLFSAENACARGCSTKPVLIREEAQCLVPTELYRAVPIHQL
ncbi:MAG: hypothetical protein ACYC64_13525 [Armatimonadota bacterium]